MKKRFNTTGVCVTRKHYMVDIANKLKEIKELIDNEFYFTINRPRQYGKTTTLSELKKSLREEYLVISVSFEGIGDSVFENEHDFCNKLLKIMSKALSFSNREESERLLRLSDDVKDLEETSEVITRFVQDAKKEVVLFIDEVDKSSNNQLFLSFIGMLRNKYLAREVEEDYTFKSVILVGLYDVKSLKLKLRPEEEAKYNSPWNIAVDFNVDMSFSPKEISTMLQEYSSINNITMDIKVISEEIYFFTNGYPFLVSRLCQIIDERIYNNSKETWTKEDVQRAVKLITNEDNTLFQSIIKNLENNNELYDLVNRILVNNETIIFNILDPVINLGVTYGIFKNSSNGACISNKIFEEVIYNYMVSKLRTKTKDMTLYNFKNNFITPENGLDIEKILIRFKQYMKENYSSVDSNFIEREGRLIFLAFITPIINGVGFALKEVQISEEKRLDLVITYNNFKYIIEMKIWRGEKYHEAGLKQLCDYLDIHDLDKGYLLIFSFNKNKEFREERVNIQDKDIFEVYV
ncbi:AAA family ATPase [Clostridium frigidicarnis]|uniref:Predicted AAA-ATPase n=1 Tax=Clostridium frigidicarnis TaxID=84698 RepID=A0A1I1AWZ3_9CLOT|nr:AAA family ATPase [Clostridium frigidicarnis]SFB42571.1 Predicted AAA-ATPase [Clostridium frigidicarnis]